MNKFRLAEMRDSMEEVEDMAVWAGNRCKLLKKKMDMMANNETPDRVSLIPRIKRVRIKDYGHIKELNIELTPSVNVIYGPSTKGKTTVINAIKHIVSGEKLRYKPNDDDNVEEALIEIELMDNKVSKKVTKNAPNILEEVKLKMTSEDTLIKLSMFNEFKKDKEVLYEVVETAIRSSPGQAIILDDFLDYITTCGLKELIIDVCTKSGAQVIMTTSSKDDIVKGANVIMLDQGLRRMKHRENNKKKEETETKSEADMIIRTTEKMLSDYNYEIDEETKEKVTNALKELKDAVGKNDVEEIKNKMNSLQKASQEMGMKMYD